MVDGVAMVWLPVQDVQRAVGFYQNTLGLKVVKQNEQWAEFDADGLRIGLNGREPEGARQDGGAVVTFEPEAGLDATVHSLQQQGVAFPGGISEHPWGRLATFKDSEGNDLQLFESPKD